MSAPLPVRDGIAPSYLYLPAGDWPDLLSFLIQRFPHVDVAQWQARFARAEVVDAHGVQLQALSAYRPQQQIFYYREIASETPIPFTEKILYRDQHIVVVDKPHFLPVIPGGRFLRETLLVRLKAVLQIDELVPVHRLDRETAGVIVFSLRAATRGLYQALFRQREVEKCYEALAPTAPHLEFPLTRRSRIERGTPFFRMCEVDGPPNSETLIEILEQRQELTCYRLRPLTGRTHQLRVHMAALGMPILNDVFYPDALPCKGDDFSAPLQLLARSLAFRDPVSGQHQQFVSERSLAW